MSVHTPVLVEETLRALNLKPGDHVIDATVGAGGHAAALLERTAPDGVLLGIDLDASALVHAERVLAPFRGRYLLTQGNFSELQIIYDRQQVCRQPRALLCDLGLSSHELQDASRGFSFQISGPLDMRFAADAAHPLTAAKILASWTKENLQEMFENLGEERFARQIAEAIVHERAARPIQTTDQLAQLVWDVVPPAYRNRRIHPATKIFQALRISVNLELTALKTFLPQAVDILQPGGRLAIISFHSLEDRIVKRYFQRESRGCVCPPDFPECRCGHTPRLKIITQKPILPSQREIQTNPRSRSARLRCAEKLPQLP